MKVLFVGRSVAHFSYYDSIIAALLRAGHSVEYLMDRKWSRKFSDHALTAFKREHPELATNYALRRTGWWRGPLFAARELRSFASYVARPEQSVYYRDRWAGYLPKPLRALVAVPPVRWFIGSKLSRALLAGLERATSADRSILASLQEKSPDVVIVSPANMRYSEEVEYLKAARTLGIPTALPVLSWDNLSTKGLLHVLPDRVLAWNESHRTDAETVHGVKPDDVAIVGAPFFDKWFDRPELPLSREDFARKVGLDPARPFAVYLGSSRNIAKDESWVVAGLRDALANHADPRLRELQLIVRPHPANADVYAKVLTDGVVLWPAEGSLPDSADAQLDFEATLRYSVCTLGINTSGMIDAVIADRPSFAIVLEEYEKTQSGAAHFQYLREYDALELVGGVAAAADAIGPLLGGAVLDGAVLDGADTRVTQRRAFVEHFVRPHGIDVSAGEASLRAIEALVVARAIATDGPGANALAEENHSNSRERSERGIG